MPAIAPKTAWTAACAAVLLGGCAAVGPDAVRPTLDIPPAYKEAGPWQPAAPQAVNAAEPWWHAFNDPALDQLIDDANAANQSIRASEAQYRQARAAAAAARSAFWPGVTANAGFSRARSATDAVQLGNAASLGVGASWEPDLWGSVRRSVEAGDASAAASADDLAAARLSIQTELAQDYLQLRITDVQRDLYATTVEADAKSLQLTQSQYRAGVALGSDVALAESLLKTTQAAAADLEVTRTQLEHAIAILTGRAPAAFTLPPVAQGLAQLQRQLPVIPTGLPSTLLERRPDIAAAERRAAAANANVGVARAAFFPSLVLSASGGYGSVAFASLLDTPSRVWSLGASLAQTLFDGGLRRAQSDQAIAAYDAAVATYKQTVLTGFQQVEDELSALRVLDREGALQAEAVDAARRAERSALSQYRAGTATYLTVLTAQTQLLTNQRSATDVVGRQLTASVSLIAAVGGGWSAADAAVPQAGAHAPSGTPSVAQAAPAQKVLP